MPEKNDYIRIQLEKGTLTGLVIKTSSEFCTLITENKERKEIKFNDISRIVENSMNNHKNVLNPKLDDIIYTDRCVREEVYSKWQR